MRTELGIATAAVRHRPGPWWLLALGIALAALMPVLAAGLRAEAARSAVADAVDASPAGARAVLTVSSRDLRGTELAGLDTSVRAGYADAGLADPQQALTFRTLALAGSDVTLGATQGLATSVRLTSGRAPRTCTPARCEVLAVTTPGMDPARPVVLDAAPTLGLAVTGTAELTDPRLVGLGLVPADQPLLLGADPAALADLTSLDLFGRTTSWTAPLDGALVARVGAAGLTRELGAIAAENNLLAGPLNVSWPSDAALAAAARAEVAGSRFVVAGVGAGALQLGFCLVVAAGLRRREQLHAALLVRRGASPRQVLLVATAQPVLAVLVGLLAGTAVGVALVASLSRTAGSAAARSALAAAGPSVLALALGAVLVTVLLTRWPATGGRGPRGAAVAGVVVAAALTALALAQGSGSGPVPTAAVVGAALAVGLVGALAWTPVVAALHRLPGPGGTNRRLVLLTDRRPLLPSVTAGFLAAACATVLLSGGYGATLRQSAQDQAAALVPLDVTVAPSTQVPLPGAVLDLDRLRAVSPAVAVHPVVSTTVTAFAGSTSVEALPLVGVDPAVLPGVHAYAATTGSRETAAALADRLRVTTAAQDGPVLPAGTREVRLEVTGLTDDVFLGLWSVGEDGQEQLTPLTRTGSSVVGRLTGSGARTVRALEVIEDPNYAGRRQHEIGESSTAKPRPSGTLRLGPVTADGRALDWTWSGWGSDQADLTPTAARLGAAYRLEDRRVVLVPGWTAPADRTPLRVAVDPTTAARATNGRVGLSLNGVTQPAEIVSVLPRFPAQGAVFALADRAAVAALVDRTAPGTAPVTQVWIDAPGAALAGVRAVLADSAAATATLDFRADLAASRAADPVATRFVLLLGAAGLIALLLGVVAVVTGVLTDRDASAADLFALEVDGLPPPRLRRVLLGRSALVLVVALPLGVLGGIGVTALAVRLLGVGPGGTAVNPPLRLVLASAPTAWTVVVAVLALVAAALVASAATFRGSRALAPELDLR